MTRGSREPVLTGPRVYRIHWVPGTDRLHAVCHCGAERRFEEPIPLWEWLLAHPDHDPPPEPRPVREEHQIHGAPV